MDPDTLKARLEDILEKRGYLLPHHGLMAVSGSNLLDAYDQTYEALTLSERFLSRLDHETVWLAILINSEEALATHHIAKFFDAGGTREMFTAIQAMTACATGIRTYEFVDRHWRPHLPGLECRDHYLATFESLAGDIPLPIAHAGAAGIMTCMGHWTGLRWHIVAFREAGGEDEALAEALSLAMFPGSIPHFVEAADTWRKLILDGQVEASPAFRTWAELSGQGGYDEASGVTGQ